MKSQFMSDLTKNSLQGIDPREHLYRLRENPEARVELEHLEKQYKKLTDNFG